MIIISDRGLDKATDKKSIEEAVQTLIGENPALYTLEEGESVDLPVVETLTILRRLQLDIVLEDVASAYDSEERGEKAVRMALIRYVNRMTTPEERRWLKGTLLGWVNEMADATMNRVRESKTRRDEHG